MSKRKIPKSASRRIAKERIELLLQLAEREMRGGRERRMRRYIDLALNIGMRYNVPLARWKRRFCPECKNYYMYSNNAYVRLKKGRIIITCRNCGNISRYPFKE